MAHNEKLADRIREHISLTHKKIEEKKMFGGLCFMLDDKMCVAVKEDYIMVRIDPALHEKAMEQEGCKPMIHGERTMKAFLYVDESVLNTKKKLEHWLNLALAYNAIVPVAKKKKK